MTRPLDGVRVIELGEGISAAYCAGIMAVLGAEVIKVEPTGGDVTRRLGPFPQDLPDREKSALFLYLNRNKQSLTLDLETRTGQDILHEMVRKSSVVVENNAPGYLQERGVGYETLSRDNPAVVLTSITPFGQTGPYRDYRATELALFAMGGLMVLCGDIKREPLKLGGNPMLYAGGLFGFASTMVALHLAEATGMGQHVDVSILEGIGASHFQDLIDYEYLGRVRRRGELRTPIPCLDGFISFTVQAHQWPDFRRLILGEAAGDDDAEVVDRDRRRLEGQIDNEILLWAADKTKAEAYRLAQEAHIPAAFMADARDVFESPQYSSRGFFVDIDHARAGRFSYPGFPAKLSGVEWQYSPAPLLGEDTDRILSSLVGLTEAEIGELRAAGVV